MAGAPLHVVSGPRPGRQIQAWHALLRQHPGLAPGQMVWHHARQGSRLDVLTAAAVQRALHDGGVVVACGGDGTINTVARHCWPLGVPMAVLPMGTFNYFSREHGVGEGPAVALDRLLEALRVAAFTPVPVGLLNGHVFVVNASLGLYPRLLAEREAASAQLGRSRWVALWSGLRSMLRPEGGRRLRMTARAPGQAWSTQDGGGTRDVAALFIGNNPLQLQRLGFEGTHDLHVDRERLAALMFAPQPRATLLRMLARAFVGRLPHEPELDRFTFAELRIEGLRSRVGAPAARVQVALDGERRWMTLPLKCVRAAAPLWLVALPEASARSQPETAEVGDVSRAATPLPEAA